MSWQLLSFLIVVGAIVAGFAWYERSRPASQVVALVAALAALAIAGRIAFAAFPNVKPTTDIVIFAGYALGPAPGFAVGALSGLVSNFWFGQGPWTPWQMAGWGLCGILGAALALWPRRLDRYTLAAVCGLAAVGYGALQNFSLMATYGGDLSWRHFWVLEGRAVPFEIAHAAGNVALALVAGPAMIRMLVRFRRRFEWQRAGSAPPVRPGEGGPRGGAPEPPTRRPALGTGSVAALLVAVLLAGAFASARADAAEVGNPTQGAVWLARQQNADGGWGASPGDDSAEDMTGWVMLGLEAEGTNPLDVSRGGRTGVDFLRGQIVSLTTPGDLARTILALEGAGVDPRQFGGANLVAKLLAKQRADGSYQGWPNSTGYAVIALRAAGVSGVAKSLGWLRGAQNDDGGWGDTANSPSDADATGAVLQAMGPTSKASDRGVNYLNQTQQGGGGWRLGGNGSLNTQSTSWAVQGLLAAGADPAGFKRGGASPYDYLAANQEPDGSYRYSKSSDQTPIWVTGQALVGAAEGHLPLPVARRIPKPKTSGPPTSSSAGGAAPTEPLPEFEQVPETGTLPSPLPDFPATGGSSASGGGPASPGGRPGKASSKKHKPPTAKRGQTGGLESGKPGQSRPSEPPAEEPEPTGGETGTITSHFEPQESDSSPPIAGSILTGALAGCLLFGAGWGGRRAFMHWRYGL